MDEQAVATWQLGRPLRAFRGVAVSCPHGYPAVTEQAAFADDGTPFPTTYWLTCPWLSAAVSRIEAAGGVQRWTLAAEADPALADSRERADAEQRRLRPELDAGIGGATRGRGLKCLHAHVAFALARPGYDLGERMLAEVDARWCPDARCVSATGQTG